MCFDSRKTGCRVLLWWLLWRKHSSLGEWTFFIGISLDFFCRVLKEAVGLIWEEKRTQN